MKRQAILLLVAVFLLPLTLFAKNYSATFTNSSAKATLATLTEVTGCEFVYHKGLIDDIKETVSGRYTDVSLDELLESTLLYQLGLQYKIVDTTVSLSKAPETFSPKSVITGIVTDENGETLPGATVRLDGTDIATATDIDGAFSMVLNGPRPRLSVSYVGMKPQTVTVNPRKDRFVKITLETAAELMEEVVVTGYQTIKREKATGAYQTVTEKDMDRRYSGSLTSNLEGKVPGLMSYDNGIDSGEDAITIRGASSFQAATKPLIVVDGLPIEGSLETVNPYDIASITVLKDAAAAAIYGARASNGVIVISTKRAKSEKVTVDFNTDITVTERNDYSNRGWASAAELIELEKYNFDWMVNEDGGTNLSTIADRYNNLERRFTLSPVMRDLYAHHVGDLSDADFNSRMARYAANDYVGDWQDAFEKTRVLQQYNLAVRVQGKALSSSIVANYKADNNGLYGERETSLTFKYAGDWTVNKWLSLSFGVNFINERAKNNALRPGISAYANYYGLRNPDGSLYDLSHDFDNNVPAIKNPEYGLKTMFYNPIAEKDMGMARSRRTNIRSYLRGVFTILPGWTASGHFQYEDIYFKRDTYREAETYTMRSLYNHYTGIKTVMVEDYDEDFNPIQIPQQQLTHYIPEGGRLDTSTSEGAFYTLRAQTQFQRTLWGKHDIDVLAGWEFRESRTKDYSTLMLGYDDQTQTNQNGFLNWKELAELFGAESVMGPDYPMGGAPDGSSFSSGDVLHRFYSLYATANYVYDNRYALSGSWRIDKTDLFGADPKFRGRPLWSVGASWNAHNEAFMKDFTWINALKPRVSYGLTGNIDSSVSSFLTASIDLNFINQGKYATLDTPPNDQLRWEKTATWNFGVDFALLDYRLRGSLDYYHKKGTDLLTTTDLDPTTGWSILTINNGNMVNKGVELQLDAEILRARNRNQLGLNVGLNLAYNSNKVTKVAHEPATGSEALGYYTLHQGYPVHSLFSYDYAGLVAEGDMQYYSWRGKDGQIHTSDISSTEFTVEDAVYSGSLDPKWTGSLVPELTYRGFSLSAMLSYYGGHVMRVNVNDYQSCGSEYGYSSIIDEPVHSTALNFWRTSDHTLYPANGAQGKNVVGANNRQYQSSNVVPADYIKLRNVVIGYTLPQSLTRKAGINEARLRVQLNNLATWHRNNAGKDPEAVNPLSGTDYTSIPRSYTFSLMLNF